jgi:hypothetical protein
MADFFLCPALGQGRLALILFVAQNLVLAIVIVVLAKQYLTGPPNLHTTAGFPGIRCQPRHQRKE